MSIRDTVEEISIKQQSHTNDNSTKKNYINTYANKLISFENIEEKTWDDIDLSMFKPSNINHKIHQVIKQEKFDISQLSLPIGDWLDTAFMAIFNTQANIIKINISLIDISNFFNDLLKTFKFISNYHIRSAKIFDNDNIMIDNDQILLCLDDSGLLLHKNYDQIHIHYSPQHYLNEGEEKLISLFSVMKKYRKSRVRENHISIIYNDGRGLTKNVFPLKKRDINLEENYNDEFIDVSNDLITKLNDKNKTGLFILHGEHGTGKTTYIRYLASILKREVIFIPPDMVDIITSPSFIGFLMDNPDSVLIIEDGESAIQQRDNVRTNGVANILNMTDGLLSDCLNISIVVTFNTNTKNLDEALLRKGRLMKRYEFGKLTQDKAQKLLDKLGINKKATGPMRLSDIYYADDNNETESFTEKKYVKGFNRK